MCVCVCGLGVVLVSGLWMFSSSVVSDTAKNFSIFFSFFLFFLGGEEKRGPGMCTVVHLLWAVSMAEWLRRPPQVQELRFKLRQIHASYLTA